MSSLYKKRRSQKKATRVMWSDDEDKKLILIVKENGPNQDTWKKAAEQLDGRNIKQCRERWCNQLDPNVKKGQWTLAEEELIIKLQQEIGKGKWLRRRDRIRRVEKERDDLEWGPELGLKR